MDTLSPFLIVGAASLSAVFAVGLSCPAGSTDACIRRLEIVRLSRFKRSSKMRRNLSLFFALSYSVTSACAFKSLGLFL